MSRLEYLVQRRRKKKWNSMVNRSVVYKSWKARTNCRRGLDLPGNRFCLECQKELPDPWNLVGNRMGCLVGWENTRRRCRQELQGCLAAGLLQWEVHDAQRERPFRPFCASGACDSINYKICTFHPILQMRPNFLTSFLFQSEY